MTASLLVTRWLRGIESQDANTINARIMSFAGGAILGPFVLVSVAGRQPPLGVALRVPPRLRNVPRRDHHLPLLQLAVGVYQADTVLVFVGGEEYC